MTTTDAVGYLDVQVPAETTLPPFTGDDTVCVKCRNLEAFTRYRPTQPSNYRDEFNGGRRRGPLPERLERECTRCDYQWDEALPVDDHADGGLTVDDLVRALDDTTPYPVELRVDILRYMATRLLEMVVVFPIREHPLWQPDEPQPEPVVPQDAESLATPETRP